VACRRGLEQIGAKVRIIETNPSNGRVRAERLSRVAAYSPVLGQRAAGYIQARHRLGQQAEVFSRIQRTAEEWRPDLLLFILAWGERLAPDMFANFDGVAKVGWLMDDPFLHDGSLARALPLFDRLYVVDEAWANNVRLASGRTVRLLSCGADIVSNRPVAAEQVPAALRSNLIFVGTSYADAPAGLLRSVLLRDVADLDLKVFGDPGWANGGPTDPLAMAYQGRKLLGDEANLAYNAGRIILNIHHPQFNDGTSLRTFAVAGAGAFQMSDFRPGITRFFKPDREIVTFTSPNDLRDKAKYYLANDTARHTIAEAGLKRVRAEHTYAHRFAEMLSDCGFAVPNPPSC
jgi:spore maturation protein CgeB